MVRGAQDPRVRDEQLSSGVQPSRRAWGRSWVHKSCLDLTSLQSGIYGRYALVGFTRERSGRTLQCWVWLTPCKWTRLPKRRWDMSRGQHSSVELQRGPPTLKGNRHRRPRWERSWRGPGQGGRKEGESPESPPQAARQGLEPWLVQSPGSCAAFVWQYAGFENGKAWFFNDLGQGGPSCPAAQLCLLVLRAGSLRCTCCLLRTQLKILSRRYSRPKWPVYSPP